MFWDHRCAFLNRLTKCVIACCGAKTSLARVTYRPSWMSICSTPHVHPIPLIDSSQKAKYIFTIVQNLSKEKLSCSCGTRTKGIFRYSFPLWKCVTHIRNSGNVSLKKYPIGGQYGKAQPSTTSTMDYFSNQFRATFKMERNYRMKNLLSSPFSFYNYLLANLNRVSKTFHFEYPSKLLVIRSYLSLDLTRS